MSLARVNRNGVVLTLNPVCAGMSGYADWMGRVSVTPGVDVVNVVVMPVASATPRFRRRRTIRAPSPALMTPLPSPGFSVATMSSGPAVRNAVPLTPRVCSAL